MKTVLVYEVIADGLRKAHNHDEAHRVWRDDFYAGGLLLMAGPFANPAEGYMAVFTSREAAEEFIQGDPLVANGIIGSWTLRDWDEALSK
jgi:uncharacterized protein YciI